MRVLFVFLWVVLGCGLGEPVRLATDDTPVGANVGCLGLPNIGVLIEDPTNGTALDQDGEGYGIEPVIWPTGYTGRRVGPATEVLDPAGKVVATTGRRYQIYPADGREGFVVCGDVIPR